VVADHPLTQPRKQSSLSIGPVTQLSSTRVLVTGATSGLGRAMAAARTAAGARVAIASRDEGWAAAVASELGAARRSGSPLSGVKNARHNHHIHIHIPRVSAFWA
jgi:NAD(P)-dependent dehydrogenase (short-subunit alcohol dehydrogenase family)